MSIDNYADYSQCLQDDFAISLLGELRRLGAIASITPQRDLFIQGMAKLPVEIQHAIRDHAARIKRAIRAEAEVTARNW